MHPQYQWLLLRQMPNSTFHCFVSLTTQSTSSSIATLPNFVKSRLNPTGKWFNLICAEGSHVVHILNIHFASLSSSKLSPSAPPTPRLKDRSEEDFNAHGRQSPRDDSVGGSLNLFTFNNANRLTARWSRSWIDRNHVNAIKHEVLIASEWEIFFSLLLSEWRGLLYSIDFWMMWECLWVEFRHIWLKLNLYKEVKVRLRRKWNLLKLEFD